MDGVINSFVIVYCKIKFQRTLLYIKYLCKSNGSWHQENVNNKYYKSLIIFVQYFKKDQNYLTI